MKTYAGGLLSLFIVFLTFLFALLKLQHLLDYKNPSISTFDQEIEAGEENAFPLSSDDGFNMAFTLDKFNGSVINDERYFKWVARFVTQKADG